MIQLTDTAFSPSHLLVDERTIVQISENHHDPNSSRLIVLSNGNVLSVKETIEEIQKLLEAAKPSGAE